MANVNKYAIRSFAVIIVIAASFGFGRFSTWFEVNSCYSDVVKLISAESSEVVRANDSEKIDAFREMISSLPFRGYETECEELQTTIYR